MWSSGYEQKFVQKMLKEIGITHTSMDLGDLFFNLETNRLFRFDINGFSELPHQQIKTFLRNKLSYLDIYQVQDFIIQDKMSEMAF